MNTEHDVLKQETKDNPLDSKSEIIIAVLAVISKKSRQRKRTIAATSLREIKNGIKNTTIKMQGKTKFIKSTKKIQKGEILNHHNVILDLAFR